MKRAQQVLLILCLLVILPGAVRAVTGAESLITINTSSSRQMVPAISGDRIVWQDDRNGNWDIYLYDLGTGIETRVTTDSGAQTNPDIDHDLIVWQDGRNGNNDIYLYNISNPVADGERVTLNGKDQTYPAISGDLIVWQDNRDGNNDVYLYNLSQPVTNGEAVTSDTMDQMVPDIDGNIIVWQDYRNDNDWNIYLYNISSPVPDGEQVTSDGNEQMYPAISRDHIVWQDYRNDNDWNIYLYNISNPVANGEQVTLDESDQKFPAISGDRTIWQDYRHGPAAIYLYDLAALEENSVAIKDHTLCFPQISDDRIVWEDLPALYSDVYLFTIGATGSAPEAIFTANPVSGSAPLFVQFTDSSTGSPTHRSWHFGDGGTSSSPSPGHIYLTAGIFPVSLEVSNSLGRNFTLKRDYIHTDTPPTASFTVSATAGVKPLMVAFSDTSTGAPIGWSWDFENDGIVDSTEANPVHTYHNLGTYTVNLTAANAYGGNTAIAQDLIRVMNGMNSSATTTIDGLDVNGGTQHFILDTTKVLSNTTGNTTWLSFQPQTSTGWQNVTFISKGATNFQEFPERHIEGDIGSCILESRQIVPGMFLSDIGNNLPLSYHIKLSAYPVGAEIYTTIWEGVTPADESDFKRALAKTSPDFTSILDTAYTIVFTSKNINPLDVTGATLNLSVSSDWVKANGNGNNITVVRLGDNLVNQTLNPIATSTDTTNNLDYFIIPSSKGLSRFTLVSATGSSNLLQMGQRLATQLIQSGSGSSYSGYTAPKNVQWEQPMSRGKPPEHPPATFYGEAALDITVAGITRGAMIISSEDHGANILIPAGITALDDAGNPLSRVSVHPAAPGGVSTGVGTGSTGFTGIVYDVGPRGATFSPAASLTFPIPEGLWAEQTLYTIRTYDEGTGSWTEIPTTVDPDAHTLTGQVSHLCLFGVFAAPESVTTVSSPLEAAATTPPAPGGEQVPRTPLGTFTGLLAWLYTAAAANLPATLLLLVIALSAIYLSLRGNRRSSRRRKR
jgi:beta propeller repeat protein